MLYGVRKSLFVAARKDTILNTLMYSVKTNKPHMHSLLKVNVVRART